MTTKYIRASNTSLFLLVIQLASLLSLAQAKDRPSLRGLVDPPKKARIIGGNLAQHDRFPYFAHTADDNCGGVLIAKRWVLTAAHCVDFYTPDFDIGAHSKSDGKPIVSESTILHPSYDFSLYLNDIALVYLSENVVEKPYVKISPDMVNNPGTAMTVIGFGQTDQYDYFSSSSYLQRTNVEYMDSGVCRLAYPKENIDAGMMCASSKDGNDSCAGDSGGPLLLTPTDNPIDDSLVGIVSWGYGCGDSRYPGIYTRVSRYYDWIVETMCDKKEDGPPEYCDKFNATEADEFNGLDGRTDNCGTKGAACHSNNECCSGRCDLFTNTCFIKTENDGYRPSIVSSGMGGAGGGAAPSRASRGSTEVDGTREIARGSASGRMGGAGGGAAPSRASRGSTEVDATREIARDLP